MDAARLRSHLVLSLAGSQLLLGIIYLAGAFFLLHLTTTVEIKQDKDTTQVIRGILTGAAAAAVLGIVSAAAAFGLWRKKAWGYWVSLGLVAIGTASLAYDFYDDPDRDVLPVLGMFVLLLVLFLLPQVRRTFTIQRASLGHP